MTIKKDRWEFAQTEKHLVTCNQCDHRRGWCHCALHRKIIKTIIGNYVYYHDAESCQCPHHSYYNEPERPRTIKASEVRDIFLGGAWLWWSPWIKKKSPKEDAEKGLYDE